VSVAAGPAAALRVRAAQGPPLGAIFAGIGVLGGVAVSLFGLDRLPWPLCYFKAISGLPCPTCGSTRALGRLAALDLPGALALNPLATLAAALVALWALADLALMARQRALAVELGPRLAGAVRAAVVLGVLLNWAYLIASGR
jgi:hypothetical protein